MALPISPRRLLSLAQKLAEQAKALENATDKEVMWRAAVNRAYYAAFLAGRDKFGITAKQGVHTLVKQQIDVRDSVLAAVYDSLKTLREVADYQFPPDSPAYTDWEQNWEDAEESAITLLNDIRAL